MKKLLLQYFKIVGAILVAALALIQIWDWITKPPNPSVKLHAEVSYYSVPMPDTIDNWMENLRALTDSLDVLGGFESATVLHHSPSVPQTANRCERLASLIYMYFEPTAARAVLDRYRDMYGYWSATIVNDGEKALKSVKLVLPNAFYADIYPEPEDGSSYMQMINGSVDLWELRPGQQIYVCAWTPDYPQPQDFGRVRISHSDGFGTVEIWEEPAVVFKWLNKHWVVAILLIALLCAISYFLGSRVGGLRIQTRP